MSDKVILRPKSKEDRSITFSIRIDKDLAQQYDDLSAKSNYSRNELISKALKHYIDVVEFEESAINVSDNKTMLSKKKIRKTNKDSQK